MNGLGRPLPIRPLVRYSSGGRDLLARHLAAGRRVFARLDRAPAALRGTMCRSQPNYFLPLDKAGIDVFTQPCPLRLVLEGTVRGTGGLRITGEDCATTVAGLHAAGDVATRELVTGAASGGGSLNGAWAISSGTWAGRGAARFARSRGPLPPRGELRPAGRAGMRPAGPGVSRPEVDAFVAAVRDRVLPLRHNYFRTARGLTESLRLLDALWEQARDRLGALPEDGRTALRAREAAALAAHARWMYRSAPAGAESRGVHRREDRPATDPGLAHRLLVSGLDRVAVRPDPVAPRRPAEAGVP